MEEALDEPEGGPCRVEAICVPLSLVDSPDEAVDCASEEFVVCLLCEFPFGV